MKKIFPFLLFLCCFSCKKELTPIDFNSNLISDNDTLYFTDSTSFSALHNNIFSPTCANSGCHDGTFEPDFRTIESTYNSLVYHPVIKNDLNNSFSFRVDPGNSIKSVLYHRLIVDIDGISGIMPLESEDHWNDNKGVYINNIKDWIDDGAKDIFGNSPMPPNDIPLAKGMVVFNSGDTTNPISRGSDGSVLVPNSLISVDLWISITDDFLFPNQLTYNKIKYSTSLFNFNALPAEDLVVLSNPISQLSFYNNIENYFHKYNFDLSSYNIGDVIYIKIFVKDNVNPITEIPNNGSPFVLIKHFSLTII